MTLVKFCKIKLIHRYASQQDMTNIAQNQQQTTPIVTTRARSCSDYWFHLTSHSHPNITEQKRKQVHTLAISSVQPVLAPAAADGRAFCAIDAPRRPVPVPITRIQLKPARSQVAASFGRSARSAKKPARLQPLVIQCSGTKTKVTTCAMAVCN